MKLKQKRFINVLTNDIFVNPMMFHKDFQFPLEITRLEYKVLEEFLDEGEPIVNPY